MDKILTQSLEDYLEAIYILLLKHKVVRVKNIAEYLKVKQSSVNKAINELSKYNYIDHEKYGYIDLTDQGYKKANEIFNKHNLISNFLIKILNVSEENSYKDACIIEHYLSNETISKMEEFMKNYKK
ncbi:MAG: metal-dependent transcriptional regulator [Spirochaetes bacterium]|nr:metal-dependent transcriptional regulator [Spirochaetota bacterium]